MGGRATSVSAVLDQQTVWDCSLAGPCSPSLAVCLYVCLACVHTCVRAYVIYQFCESDFFLLLRPVCPSGTKALVLASSASVRS